MLTDTSIFQGVIQFNAPDGHEYRFSGGKVFRSTASGFVFLMTVSIKNPTPDRIWKEVKKCA